MENKGYGNQTGLSVIIPVYNAEKYLQACLDSIVNEKIENLQIILIDDGSTDGSLQICQMYGEKYDFISYIHKKNEGPGVARNLGISVAEKPYLMFVDADDMLKKGSGVAINERIQKPFDVCFLGAEFFFPDGGVVDLGDNIKRFRVQQPDEMDVIKYLASLPKFPGSPCTKIFRTDFLRDHEIAFPHENLCAEDLLFVIKALMNAKSFDAIEHQIYRYRQNVQGSRSSNLSQNHKRIIAFVDEAVTVLTVDQKPKDAKARYLLSYVVYEYYVLMLYYAQLKKNKSEESKDLKDYLTRMKWLLKFSSNTKQRIARLLCGVLGINGVAAVVSIIKR